MTDVGNPALVNRGGEPAKIALGLLKLTVPSGEPARLAGSLVASAPRNSRNSSPVRAGKPSVEWLTMSVCTRSLFWRDQRSALGPLADSGGQFLDLIEDVTALSHFAANLAFCVDHCGVVTAEGLADFRQ